MTNPTPLPVTTLQPVLCIVGPTGSGKSAAALALAKVLPISVINADSRQVYRDFPLITAQPSAEEQAECPHLLYGFLETGAALGAGEFARFAARSIREEAAKGSLPVLVGGTGLYCKVLFEGMAAIPDIPGEIAAYWQARCAEEGSPALHALLAQHDPAYAAKIHPNDKQRVTRALEVWQHTGKSFSWWHARPLPPPAYAVRKIGIGLPLPELEPLLATRIDQMLAAGAIKEAARALEQCRDKKAPGWSGIGCAELFDHLNGDLSLDECKALWLKNTRAYAKRQYTWFRADPDIHWFRPDDGELEECLRRLGGRGRKLLEKFPSPSPQTP